MTMEEANKVVRNSKSYHFGSPKVHKLANDNSTNDYNIKYFIEQRHYNEAIKILNPSSILVKEYFKGYK